MSENNIQKSIARIFSIVFHPVFIPTLVIATLVFFAPQMLYGVPQKIKTNWILIVAYTSILFPLLTVFLLWKLKFIDSMYMHGLKERYGPLIASMLFYFWIFWLFHKQFAAPLLIQSFLFGVFLTTVLTFLCSIFFKISMHTAAWSGVVVFFIFYTYYFSQNAVWFLLISILIAGYIGTARLVLKAHIPTQIYAGYVVGALAQCLAFFSIKIIFF